jgi:hypothetical protein
VPALTAPCRWIGAGVKEASIGLWSLRATSIEQEIEGLPLARCLTGRPELVVVARSPHKIMCVADQSCCVLDRSVVVFARELMRDQTLERVHEPASQGLAPKVRPLLECRAVFELEAREEVVVCREPSR